jgi:excisionase family DNA binding protein
LLWADGIGLAISGRMPEAILSMPAPVRSVFVEEAARMLGVSRRTVYYRIREGRLRSMRTRCGSQRVLLESIDTLLREDAAKRRARTLRRLPSEAEPLALQIEALP